MLEELQKNINSDYGYSYRKYPERVIPPIAKSDIDNKAKNGDGGKVKKNKKCKIKECKELYFKTPYLNIGTIFCENNKNLPTPVAYFKKPHTLLKSFLYLSDPDFRDGNTNKLVETCHELFLQKRGNKKLANNVLSNLDGKFDTDPDRNFYFKVFIRKVLKKCGLIIILADENNKFVGKIIKNPKKKPIYVIVRHHNSNFSPYGSID